MTTLYTRTIHYTRTILSLLYRLLTFSLPIPTRLLLPIITIRTRRTRFVCFLSLISIYKSSLFYIPYLSSLSVLSSSSHRPLPTRIPFLPSLSSSYAIPYASYLSSDSSHPTRDSDPSILLSQTLYRQPPLLEQPFIPPSNHAPCPTYPYWPYSCPYNLPLYLPPCLPSALFLHPPIFRLNYYCLPYYLI